MLATFAETIVTYNRPRFCGKSALLDAWQLPPELSESKLGQRQSKYVAAERDFFDEKLCTCEDVVDEAVTSSEIGLLNEAASNGVVPQEAPAAYGIRPILYMFPRPLPTIFRMQEVAEVAAQKWLFDETPPLAVIVGCNNSKAAVAPLL
jgi:hypothetical protein